MRRRGRELEVGTAADQLVAWLLDPCRFVRECFGAEPDAWQDEVLAAYGGEPRRISMRACAGPGKSAVLAWCGLHFLLTRGDGENFPNGAAVSVTSDNLRDNLWKEFSVWMDRSEVFRRAFVWTSERIFEREHREKWFLSARSFPKTASAEEMGRTLSGLHAKYILYLIDESGTIEPSVLKAAEQGLSNCGWGKILQAGNPISRKGVLYQSVVPQAHMWKSVRVTGDPDDPRRSKRIDLEWAKEQIRLYGRDDPWVKAYILGEFPDADFNALLGVEDVGEAMRRERREGEYDWSQKRLGVDCARFGPDATVVFPRQGLRALAPVVRRGADTHEIAALVAMEKARWGGEVEFVDDTGGYGAGVVDALIQAGTSPVPVNFAGKATDPRYYNRRSEMWFRMADWVKRGGVLPDLPELVEGLTTPTYYFQDGKFRLEEKERIKARMRGGVGLDMADALALTFALPDMGSASFVPAGASPAAPAGNKLLSDWDPMGEERG